MFFQEAASAQEASDAEGSMREMRQAHMNKMCGMSIAGIFMLLLLPFVANNKAEAQAKRSDSVRFLSREKIQAMIYLSTYGPLDEGRPNYPVIMRGRRLSFDQPWLSFIFDHPVLWFVEEAAVASLRNYSDVNSHTSLDGKTLVENSAADMSKDFFRRVLLNPFNHTYMPKKTAIDLDVGDTGAIGVRGIDAGVMLRFNAQF
jgi:hypothetical protein